MHSIPVFCRWWVAPIIVSVSACMGSLLYFISAAFEPSDEFDGFYFGLYSGIGAMFGFAAWYFARLVTRQSASWFAITLIIAPAYLFILFLALDKKNPGVAVLATLAFGFVLWLMLLANRSNRKEQTA